MTQEQLKYEKRRLEKKKLLEKIEEQIEYLERQIILSKNKNKKNSKIRNLKIVLGTLQLVYPYIIAAGISFGGIKLLGLTPFTSNTNKEYLDTMKEFDSLGNVRYEQQYIVKVKTIL